MDETLRGLVQELYDINLPCCEFVREHPEIEAKGDLGRFVEVMDALKELLDEAAD